MTSVEKDANCKLRWQNFLGFVIGLLVLAILGYGLLVRGSSTKAQIKGSQTKALKIKSMRLLTSDEGWVLGDRHLFWTNSAGEKWVEITPQDLGTSTILNAFFIDRAMGWVVTLQDDLKSESDSVLELSTTTDGGQTWSKKPLATLSGDGIGSVSVDFTDVQNGWVMTRLASNSNFNRGLLLATTDGGQTWNKLPAPPAGNPVNFTSATDGWIVGGPGDNSLYVTRDGGYSWRQQSVRYPSAEYKTGEVVYTLPSFQNSQDGTLLATFTRETRSSVVFYDTRNGGKTWSIRTILPISGEVGTSTSIVSSVADYNTVITILPQDSNLVVLERNAQPRSSGTLTNLSSDAAITRVDFKNSKEGWLVVSVGRCLGFKAECVQETTLLATTDGGQTTTEITPQIEASETDIQPNPESVVISKQKGFDKCAADTVSRMQTWWNSSPYYDANIYIGGVNRGCSQGNLTSSWVTSIFNQGWRLIPTWVGLQGPGSVCTGCSKMSTNTSTARSQGRNEAEAAANAANNLGLRSRSIIYYDMERYDTTSTGRAAVQAFIDGWVDRLGERGYDAGVYGSPKNALEDWQGSGITPPRAVWIAKWDGRETVFGLSPLPDGLWCCSQRIHQYRGDHNETWGGVTFNIDNNISDGPVARP